MMKKTISCALFMSLALSALGTLSVSAMTPAIAIGTAYLKINNDLALEGGGIYTDGQYDMTWEISDDWSIDDATTVDLRIENISPYALGTYDNVKLSIDEIWLDGVKVEGEQNGSVSYSIATDYAFGENGVTVMQYRMRDGAYDDISSGAKESIRIVYTLSNLAPPIDPNSDVTTTTESVSDTETTTTAPQVATPTADLVNVATSQTSLKTESNHSSPKTGDSNTISLLITLMVTAGGSIRLFGRKKKHKKIL